MTAISRRELLTGSSAATLAGHAAFAAAPKANAQGPGVYRSKLGDFQLTALYDGTWFLKIDDEFPEVTESLCGPQSCLPASRSCCVNAVSVRQSTVSRGD